MPFFNFGVETSVLAFSLWLMMGRQELRVHEAAVAVGAVKAI